MIHGFVDADCSKLNLLDYRCSVNDFLEPGFEFEFVPNVVSFPEVFPEYQLMAGKALYVGRIDSEKLLSVKSFVEVCRRYGIEYEIAGSLSGNFKVQAWAALQPKGTFIGVINTRSFLIEHGAEYAFIGGVGQVVLETVAANLPCLVATHRKDALRSAFVTQKNLNALLRWNCVLRGCPEELVARNTDAFFEARTQAMNGDGALLQKYFARSVLESLRNADEIWSHYRKVLLGL